jgi:hypothetical protein
MHVERQIAIPEQGDFFVNPNAPVEMYPRKSMEYRDKPATD